MKRKYEKPITIDLSHVLTVMGASPDSCSTGSSAEGDPNLPSRPQYCFSGSKASGDRCAGGDGPNPLICHVGRTPTSGKSICSGGGGF
jgi:hypothetical protein